MRLQSDLAILRLEILKITEKNMIFFFLFRFGLYSVRFLVFLQISILFQERCRLCSRLVLYVWFADLN